MANVGCLRFKRLLAIVLLAGFVFMTGVAQPPLVMAGDDGSLGDDYYLSLSCNKLWYERNAIYAAAGFCFKSERGIANFGSACRPPYGKIPAYKKDVADHIKSIEVAKGC